jgi:hypothetical protein
MYLTTPHYWCMCMRLGAGSKEATRIAGAGGHGSEFCNNMDQPVDVPWRLPNAEPSTWNQVRRHGISLLGYRHARRVVFVPQTRQLSK